MTFKADALNSAAHALMAHGQFSSPYVAEKAVADVLYAYGVDTLINDLAAERAKVREFFLSPPEEEYPGDPALEYNSRVFRVRRSQDHDQPYFNLERVSRGGGRIGATWRELVEISQTIIREEMARRERGDVGEVPYSERSDEELLTLVNNSAAAPTHLRRDALAELDCRFVDPVPFNDDGVFTLVNSVPLGDAYAPGQRLVFSGYDQLTTMNNPERSADARRRAQLELTNAGMPPIQTPDGRWGVTRSADRVSAEMRLSEAANVTTNIQRFQIQWNAMTGRDTNRGPIPASAYEEVTADMDNNVAVVNNLDAPLGDRAAALRHLERAYTGDVRRVGSANVSPHLRMQGGVLHAYRLSVATREAIDRETQTRYVRDLMTNGYYTQATDPNRSVDERRRAMRTLTRDYGANLRIAETAQGHPYLEWSGHPLSFYVPSALPSEQPPVRGTTGLDDAAALLSADVERHLMETIMRDEQSVSRANRRGPSQPTISFDMEASPSLLRPSSRPVRASDLNPLIIDPSDD